jgi:hypothetical protein
LKRGIEGKAGRKWREKFGFLEERRSILFFYISYFREFSFLAALLINTRMRKCISSPRRWAGKP